MFLCVKVTTKTEKKKRISEAQKENNFNHKSITDNVILKFTTSARK